MREDRRDVRLCFDSAPPSTVPACYEKLVPLASLYCAAEAAMHHYAQTPNDLAQWLDLLFALRGRLHQAARALAHDDDAGSHSSFLPRASWANKFSPLVGLWLRKAIRDRQAEHDARHWAAPERAEPPRAQLLPLLFAARITQGPPMP